MDCLLHFECSFFIPIIGFLSHLEQVESLDHQRRLEMYVNNI